MLDANLIHATVHRIPPSADNILGPDSGRPTSALDLHLENALKWAQQRFPDEEFVQAKEEFFQKFGKVFYDDSFYERRMSYFLDYFLLERPLSQLNHASIVMTPDNAFREDSGSGRYFALTETRHSIFRILKNSISNIEVEDLLSGNKICIMPRDLESFKYMEKKEVFQGYLYFSEDKCYLSYGIIFHPAKVFKLIKKQVKKLQQSPDTTESLLLSQLATKNLKFLRHAHVDPKRIYSEISL